MKNKKGFSLIELVIAVLLISVLATVALSSYFNSTDTFSFLSVYKTIASDIRDARSYAINNKMVGNVESDRYGICMTARTLVIFADSGNKPLAYEKPAGGPSCPPTPPNEIIGDPKQDSVVKTYSFASKYSLSVYGSKTDLDANRPLVNLASLLHLQSVSLFYEKSTGKFTVAKNNREIVPNDQFNKYIILKLAEGTKRVKYIVIFQMSGMPEEYNNLDVFL